ncbi:MAG: substrate-binding domain-containing protein [Caulobacteraceae bacterium]|nr:substrate-binding domain-containing protein [Caulobacteraceae bacterium]
MKSFSATKLFATVAVAAAVAASGGATANAQAARDYVWAAGSSTVFPFATRVAENFARKTGKKAPKVESLGTGGGIKLFCGGAGAGFPDIANASRPMKKAEWDACAAHGVRDIIELRVGFDGIVVATDKDGADYNFKLEHFYFAFAKTVLRGGRLVPNPYNTWDEIGAGLPGNRIVVYGPPPTSGTRDAFLELAMEAGARRFPTLDAIRADNERRFKALAGTIREDGRWIDAGENDNAIVATLTRTPGALGIFGYSFLEENQDRVKGATVNGVAPTAANIASGAYPLSRSLYIYVKKSALASTPGAREFVQEFLSDAATGRGGYLQARGLIPLPASQHNAQKASLEAGRVMARPAA